MTLIAVTLYTAGPGCMPCQATKRRLAERGIPYTEVPISDDHLNVAAAQYLGFTTTPVVCATTTDGDQCWDGYRPDRIDALADATAASSNGKTQHL